ncbi:pyridoxamine 5'-phosphate oxidase [Endozoicomonas montiporae]|uniref:Pyridoxamine 5'-phosphate oxidase n=2 Tax=Endozoicomonas montiporae TaxID=1027273 RepID=A0A081N592_9GAMM|nr:pyridoxamine 5'-phosphate oxidase family protein [Endozoicomonas montiporae]AMO57505.1 putative Pyridoxamine 5'-phosphate oxidase [Endozoicomonas montiporae CL-33]KEQ13615.1 pyridoxamine 5'-phosphate oxidase [Endozoicomonas montiporae]
MGKQFLEITDEQIEFIEKQHIFFVGTAAQEGTVNVSPKGMDSLKVLNRNTVAWLNLTGSGNETSAHVQINPRMTIMFCAFEGRPVILRLYGQSDVLHPAHREWGNYISLFPEMPGSRQIFLLHVEKTQISCGMGVPLYDYKQDRDALVNTFRRRGKEGTEDYWQQKNQKSIDGFDTNITGLSGLETK